MDCQAFFDIGTPSDGLIYQAAIGFDESREAYWPFDELNEALGFFYTKRTDVPQICPVVENGTVIGYIILPRNSLSSDELRDLFREELCATGDAQSTDTGYEITRQSPFATEVEYDGQTIGIMCYRSPAGESLPLEAINYTIRMLMGQTNWPTDLAPWLYPVAKGASSLLGGLLIAPTIDNLNDDPNADDALFRRIRAFNYPGMSLAGRNQLSSALKQFPDFQKKEFRT